jgi:hypothetical protein
VFRKENGCKYKHENAKMNPSARHPLYSSNHHLAFDSCQFSANATRKQRETILFKLEGIF